MIAQFTLFDDAVPGGPIVLFQRPGSGLCGGCSHHSSSGFNTGRSDLPE